MGTFPTRRQAVAAIADATTHQPGRPAHAGVLLSAWAEQWWATRAGHRATTQRRNCAVLDLEVLPAFGHRPVEELSAAEVQQFVDDLAARLASTSVRRSYTVLTQLLGSAVDARLIAAAPTGRVRLPRPQRYEARLLTPDELEHLANTLRVPWRAMVLTTAYATLRIGEAAGLRRVDVDPLHGTLRVANSLVEVSGRLIEGPPKMAAGRRTMTMPASVMGEVEEHLERFAGPTHLFSAPRGGQFAPGRLAGRHLAPSRPPGRPAASAVP